MIGRTGDLDGTAIELRIDLGPYRPSSVVQTGVKSLGWLNSTAHESPTQSWKRLAPLGRLRLQVRACSPRWPESSWFSFPFRVARLRPAPPAANGPVCLRNPIGGQVISNPAAEGHAKYDLSGRDCGDMVAGVLIPSTLNDPWGEASRLSFDERCR